MPAATTVTPAGLRRSEAILATTFDVPQPNDAESPVALRISSCRAVRYRRASPDEATTRAEVEVALVDADLLHGRAALADERPHARASGGGSGRGPARTKTACGQRRRASAELIAERTPNCRAS